MHVTATVGVAGTDEQAMSTLLRAAIRLGWDLQAQAGLWMRAETGEWWEKKVEVEAVAGGGAVTIDAEPKSALGVGPAWRQMTQRAVDELVGALGGTTPAPPAQHRVEAVKVPMKQEHWDAAEWREFNEAADASAPEPARTQTLTLGGGPPGGAGGAGKAGQLLWWVVKEVAGALVAIGVGKAVDRDRSDEQKGTLEYDLHSGNMLIVWADGSKTLAPREYQPGGFG